MFELILGSEIKIFLYILVGLAYLFSRMYGKELKKQKKKSAGKRPAGKQRADEIFRELQKSLGLPETAGSEEIKPFRTASVKERKSSDKADKEAYRIFAREGPSKMKHYKPLQASRLKSRSIAAETSNENETSEGSHPVPDFDPRKAVIYAELLRRPQY